MQFLELLFSGALLYRNFLTTFHLFSFLFCWFSFLRATIVRTWLGWCQEERHPAFPCEFRDPDTELFVSQVCVEWQLDWSRSRAGTQPLLHDMASQAACCSPGQMLSPKSALKALKINRRTSWCLCMLTFCEHPC